MKQTKPPKTSKKSKPLLGLMWFDFGQDSRKERWKDCEMGYEYDRKGSNIVVIVEKLFGKRCELIIWKITKKNMSLKR